MNEHLYQSPKNGGTFQPWMSPFAGGMWPAFPFNPMGAPPSFMTPSSVQTPKDCSTTLVPKVRKRTPRGHDEEHDDVEEVEDPDFKPKRKYTTQSTRGKAAQKMNGRRAAQQAKETAKTALQHLMLRRVNSLPGPFNTECERSYVENEECPGCRLYIGSVILTPCGHAAFCFSCIDTFQRKCVSNGRLFMCPVKNCKDLITGWLRMRKVSA